MELSWVALWYRLFIPASKQVPYLAGLWILFAMILLVYLPSRLMAYLETPLNVRRAALVVLVTMNLFIGLRYLLYVREVVSLAELLNRPLRTFGDMARLIPAEFFVMLFALFVSWRGVSFADRSIGPINVLASFRLGVLMFFLYGLLLPVGVELPNRALYIFLFFSLLALSTARISVLSQLRGGHHIQFNRQWMAGLLVIIVLMVLLSAGTMYLTGNTLFGLLTLLLTWIIYLVALVLSPLLWGIVRVLSWLFSLIQIGALFDAIQGLFQRLENLLQALTDWFNSMTGRFNLESIQLLFQRLMGYKSFYLWLILLLGVAVILLTLKRRSLKDESADDQEGQPVASQDNLLEFLRNALRRGINRLAENLEDILRLNQARRMLAAARIRRIYAHLLNLSSKLDRPRLASQTPLEYLPSLERLFPGLSGQLATITGAYMQVRYGELPETAEELEQVEAAWKQVSSAGEEQLKTKRRNNA
jgi:hypothetical protein